jgi:hypothetical protein
VEELHVELVVFHDQDRLGHWPALFFCCKRAARSACGAPRFPARALSLIVKT